MPLEGIRILLVTRDRPVHDAIRTLCSQISPTYRGLEWAGSYRAALDTLEMGGVDVCILDDGLLNGSGLELLREPSLGDHEIPVVLLLEDRPLPDEDPLARPGIADWIVKSDLDLPSLQRALRHAREGRDAAVSRSRSRRTREELLLRLSDSLARARRLEDALRAAVEEIVRHLPWDVGHAYLREDGGVRSTPIWYPEDTPDHAALRRASNNTRFEVGEGIVGEALAARRPVWKSDVTADPGFVRKGHGLDIRAALAVPVLAGDEVMAVLEFFAADAREPDPRDLEAAARVSNLLAPVADRERTVEALRNGHDLESAAMDALADALFVKDVEGRYVVMNRAATAVAGRSLQEVLGRRDEEIFEPGTAAALRHGDAEVLESGETVGFETTLSAADGAARTFRITKGALRHRNGAILGLYGVAHDITEQKRREASLRAEKEELERRVRSLQALLGVGTALREPGLPLAERLERIAELVCEKGVLADRPAEARIVLHEKEFRTPGFDHSATLHRVPIRSGDGEVGVLEVTSGAADPAAAGGGGGDDGRPGRMAELLDRIARELGRLPAVDDQPN